MIIHSKDANHTLTEENLSCFFENNDIRISESFIICTSRALNGAFGQYTYFKHNNNVIFR